MIVGPGIKYGTSWFVVLARFLQPPNLLWKTWSTPVDRAIISFFFLFGRSIKTAKFGSSRRVE